ncbi:hypothetical protein B0H14DRAFT_2587666 [Mycena olivaceomarginata]|nr:hypothetical protein B0H14DRAFT_2587666 [Mycena olivaceomarginata]
MATLAELAPAPPDRNHFPDAGADNGDGWVELGADKDATTWGRMQAGQRTKMRPYDDPGDVGAGCPPDNGDERVGPRAHKGDGRLGSRVENGDEQMGPRADKGEGWVESSANKDGMHKSTARIMPLDGIFATALVGVSRLTHGSPQQTFVVRCFNA